MRKRVEVQSTSEDLYRSLHNKRFCSGGHAHQHIAGQTVVGGDRMSMSQLTEGYPGRFARQVARILLNEQSHPILVSKHESPRMPIEDHPTKKHRLGQKTDTTTIAQFPGANWQIVLKSEAGRRPSTTCRNHGG